MICEAQSVHAAHNCKCRQGGASLDHKNPAGSKSEECPSRPWNVMQVIATAACSAVSWQFPEEQYCDPVICPQFKRVGATGSLHSKIGRWQWQPVAKTDHILNICQNSSRMSGLTVSAKFHQASVAASKRSVTIAI